MLAASGQVALSGLDRTPFILERAKPSKDGDAKLWAFTLWAGCENLAPVWKGCQAAEGKDRRNARPSPDVERHPHDPGAAPRRLHSGLPCFFALAAFGLALAKSGAIVHENPIIPIPALCASRPILQKAIRPWSRTSAGCRGACR
jgi:hypothetical protein